MNTKGNIQSIAYFDFDRTIIKKDSGGIYGVALFFDRLSAIVPSLKAALAGIGYRLGWVRRRKIARLGVFCYAGLTRTEISEWMNNAYRNLISPLLSNLMVDRIKAHQQKNDLTVIISASPPFFLEAAAKDLGVDRVYGSELKFENDVCTGTYSGPYLGGHDKLITAQKVAQEHGLELSDCWFYSDHVADLALMEAVGHPICVNPEPKLRKIAEEKGWPILEHEK